MVPVLLVASLKLAELSKPLLPAWSLEYAFQSAYRLVKYWSVSFQSYFWSFSCHLYAIMFSSVKYLIAYIFTKNCRILSASEIGVPMAFPSFWFLSR